jgi:hypothetical protein
MSGIEDVLKNVLKSKVIVYDLARGEIEVDFYLPVITAKLNVLSVYNFTESTTKHTSQTHMWHVVF